MSILTRVRIAFIQDRVNDWLRFGRFHRERVVDQQRRDVYFTPHAVFCYMTWRANDYGTTLWRIDILRAVAPGERASQVSGVAPGAEILLRASGKAKVLRVLALIDAIEAQDIRPDVVSTDYWRTVHNQLAANHEPIVLHGRAHAAYLSRSLFR
jgi:Protein of unknown function (DUF2840)